MKRQKKYRGLLKLLIILSIWVSGMASSVAARSRLQALWVDIPLSDTQGISVNVTTSDTAAAYGVTYDSATNTLTLTDTTIAHLQYDGTRDLNIHIVGTVYVYDPLRGSLAENPEYYNYEESFKEANLANRWGYGTGISHMPETFLEIDEYGDTGDIRIYGDGKDASRLRLKADPRGHAERFFFGSGNPTNLDKTKYSNIRIEDITFEQERFVIASPYVACNEMEIVNARLRMGHVKAATKISATNSDIACLHLGSYQEIDLHNSTIAVDNRSITWTDDISDYLGMMYSTVKLNGAYLYGGEKGAEFQIDPAQHYNGRGWLYTSDGQLEYKYVYSYPYYLFTPSDLKLPKDISCAPYVGTKLTVGGIEYTVTDRGKKVAVSGIKNKNAISCSIPEKITVDGFTYTVTSIYGGAMKGLKKLKTLAIGRGVERIGMNAFQGCTALKKVTGGANVTLISTSAFDGCKALTSMFAGPKVITISEKAFCGCKALKSVTIGASVTTIGKQAFYKCSGLKKITIKSTKLTNSSVGAKAFTGTYKKATVMVPKKKLKAYKKFLKKKGFSKKVVYKGK